MDPLSITGTCVSLLSSIASLSTQITRFVGDVRDARKDMDAVHRELSSLSFCVESLRDDTSRDESPYPDSLKVNLISVLTDCSDVMVEIEDLLKKSSSNNLGRRMLWAASTKQEMNKLRSKLEAHKATIEIALDMASIFLIKTVKQDTSEILLDTQAIKQDTIHVPGIKEDTSQLLAKISNLEAQLLQTEQLHQGRAHILQRFLDSSTTYAETVIQPSNSDHSDTGESSSPRIDEKMALLEAPQYKGMQKVEEALSDGVLDSEPTRDPPRIVRPISQEQDSECSQNQLPENQPVKVQTLDEQLENLTIDRKSLSRPTPPPHTFLTKNRSLGPPMITFYNQKLPRSVKHSLNSSITIGHDRWQTTMQLRDTVAVPSANIAMIEISDKFEGVVIMHYVAQAPDELCLFKGEDVVVLGQVKSRDWSFLRLINNGKGGWGPTHCIARRQSTAPNIVSDRASLPATNVDVATALTSLTETLGASRPKTGVNSVQFIEKLEFLINEGADVGDKDYALLRYAVRKFQVEILQYTLHHCGRIGHNQALKAIVTLPDPGPKFPWNQMLDLIIASGVDLDHLPFEKQHTAFAYDSSVCQAAMFGHAEIVSYLIEQGVDVLHVDTFGRTALEQAEKNELCEGNTEERKSRLREVVAMLQSAEKEQRNRQGWWKKWFQ